MNPQETLKAAGFSAADASAIMQHCNSETTRELVKWLKEWEKDLTDDTAYLEIVSNNITLYTDKVKSELKQIGR